MRALKNLVLAIIQHTPIVDRMVLASAGYRVLTQAQAEKGLGGWHSPRSAVRQQRAYEKLLADFHAGHPRNDLQVAIDAVTAAGLDLPSLLEVGCGNGYYSEVFRAVPGGVRYTGLDYSAAMVESARQRYPGEIFAAGDATALAFADGSFDIVVNGVALMHILRYREAIAEATRVASSHVIFHCVPVFPSGPTAYLSKYAYGEPVIEIVFNEAELTGLFVASGLEVIRTWNAIAYDVVRHTGHNSHMVTYLCRKTGAKKA